MEEEYLIIQLVVRVIFGAIAALIAAHKGRNKIGWFFGGFFLVFIGVIIVAVLSNLKHAAAHRERVLLENRRLREQIRQEKMKGETFRQYTTGRLDTHDRALGVDTRSVEALPGPGTAGAPAARRSAPGSASGSVEKWWYYEMEGEMMGPAPERVVKDLLRTRRISPTTLVWAEDMADWTPLDRVPAFRSSV